jgi:protein-disulfide isomerase
MAVMSPSTKLILFVLVAVVGGAAGFGYFSQASKLSEGSPEAQVIEQKALTAKPNDIIIGDNNAIVTMVEYSSLSCPHCAHFHEKILPALTKEFITTGKVKLVVRHFPLNEPAIKGALTVECAGMNGLKRENFLKVLFSMQDKWAFSESFAKDLKQIALVGGIDSAAFDSCSNDKDLENRILAVRQEAATQLKVTSTPTFFINGIKYEGEPTIEGFRAIINKAGTGSN